MTATKHILLTFDVEEFDLPLEHNHQIDIDKQMDVGFSGLKAISPILQQPFIKATLFTTANFAIHFPKEINFVSKQHEIASHTFYHSSYSTDDLVKSKNTLEKIIEKPVLGLRMPRLKQIPMQDVIDAGYLYDSSINPTYLPGRYNNTHLPKCVYNDKNMIRIPTSVTPNFRLPLFWLAFKNVPYSLFKFWCLQCLSKYNYLHLYFHPWEFVDLNEFKIPFYTKRISGNELYNKLERLIFDFKNIANFISVEEFLKQKSFIPS